MKTLIAIAVLVAITCAEPPPSNSYLPPSAAGRSGGYPQGGPQVAAARSSDNHGGHGNGFARNGGHGGQARFGNGDGGYDHNAAAFGRNGLDDASGEPANYNFGYMVNDYHVGTDFGHHEERHEEAAHGEYHVVLPDGRKQTVSYEADERGFKPHISYQDSDASARSNGYDSNAQGNHGNGFGNGAHGSARSNGY